MNIIHDAVELFEELLLFLLNVLILLVPHLILPFEIGVLLLRLHNLALLISQLLADLIIEELRLLELGDLLLHVLERPDNLIVVGVLDHLLSIGRRLTDLLSLEVSS